MEHMVLLQMILLHNLAFKATSVILTSRELQVGDFSVKITPFYQPPWDKSVKKYKIMNE